MSKFTALFFPFSCMKIISFEQGKIVLLKNAQTSTKKIYLIKIWKFTPVCNPLVVQLPGDEGGGAGVVGGAGVGLWLAGQQRRLLLRHRDPRGQEVHVEGDRLLPHWPVVVARLARHVGVEIRPEEEEIMRRWLWITHHTALRRRTWGDNSEWERDRTFIFIIYSHWIKYISHSTFSLKCLKRSSSRTLSRFSDEPVYK